MDQPVMVAATITTLPSTGVSLSVTTENIENNFVTGSLVEQLAAKGLEGGRPGTANKSEGLNKLKQQSEKEAELRLLKSSVARNAALL